MSVFFDGHAVRRIQARHIPVHIVETVAAVGVPVRETNRTVLLRGQWGDKSIHVLKWKQTNTVHTVYVADEWESYIAVTRTRKKSASAKAKGSHKSVRREEFP